MNRPVSIDALLALLLFGLAGVLRVRGLFPGSSVVEVLSLLCAAASFLFALLALRGTRRYDRFCAKAVLGFLLLLTAASWFFGGVVP